MPALLIFTFMVMVWAPTMRASSILAGSDYRTTAAALFDFGVGIGPVALRGAFGPGVADTVLTRLEDATLPAVGSSDSVAIQMRLLELRSVAPVFIGGSFFDVFVHLNPMMPSTGTMTISHDFMDNGTPAAEGTFTSSLTLNFIADFVPTGPGAAMSQTGSLALTTPGPLPWSHEPPPGAVILPGPAGDLNANLHAPLPPGFNDFFPLLIIEQHPGVGIHVAQLAVQNCAGPDCQLQAIVPEPGTYASIAIGLGLFGVRLLVRKRWLATRKAR